jgi:NAD(P)-dependent dehydrogenase (short-subunit alcohol dehydrogenase family)
VILACRDLGRAEAAVTSLRAAAPSAHVEAMALDLASLDSVRAFAKELQRRVSTNELPPLRALVCNAGLQGGKTFTADGFETTFGVNHLGHFLLVNLLLPSLKAPARIVVVSSGVHDPAKKTGMPDPAWNAPAALARGEMGPAAQGDSASADSGRRYTTSKLANVYFTYELARRLPAGVTINAFNPGLMPGTGLAREYPAPFRWLWLHVLPRMIPLLRLVRSPDIHTVDASGAALAWLVTDPALAETSGKYFSGRTEIRSSEASYDVARASELWQASTNLTGLG